MTEQLPSNQQCICGDRGTLAGHLLGCPMYQEQRPSKELLSCPFCGRDAQLTMRVATLGEGGGFVAIVSCFCGGYSARAHQFVRADDFDTARDSVTHQWNQRAPSPPPDGIASISMEMRGNKFAVVHCFDSLEQAQAWRNGLPLTKETSLAPPADICPTTGHPHRMPKGQVCLYCHIGNLGSSDETSAVSSADHYQRTGSPMCWCGHRKASHDHAGCCGICSCVKYGEPESEEVSR